jgi:hypothetical protein
MRPVPHLIDNNSRLGEYLMVFMVPLFMLRTIDPVFGLFVGTASCVFYIRLTIDQAPGYLPHLLYRIGLPQSGLPRRHIRKLLP